MGMNVFYFRFMEEFLFINCVVVLCLLGRLYCFLLIENCYGYLFDVVIQLKYEDKDIYLCFFLSDDDSVFLIVFKVE